MFLELACAFGQLPHEVARWPWRRVQRCWVYLRRKQRRDTRIQLLMAQHTGMGAMAGMFGGGSGASESAPSIGGNDGLDARGLRDIQALGIPVKTVKVPEG